MAKPSMQDMIPPEKRTVRNITIDKPKRASTPVQEAPTPVMNEPEIETPTPPRDTYVPPPLYPTTIKKTRSGKPWWSWLLGALGVIVVVFLILSFIFSGAKLEVEPKNEAILIDGQFTAYKTPTAPDLGFEIMTVSKPLTRVVDATGERFVDRKASGRIIVYNDYSEEDQRLIKNTRFETTDGLIYRISDSIVIPGRHTDSAGKTVPGSIEVEVSADTSGEEYNIGLSKFTIPGFKDKPEYTKFYAESKTSMQGGFSGYEKTVSEKDEQLARTELQEELRTSISEEVAGQVPEGYVLYPNASFITFSTLQNKATEDEDKVEVGEEISFHGVIFKKIDLAKYVAEKTLASYDGADVELLAIEDLEMNVVDKDSLDPLALETIDFTLTGNDTLVWLYDEMRLKNDLSGKHRKDVEMVLSGYPSIDRAEIILRPFWKRSFPDDVEDIKIERILPKEE